MLGDRIAAQGLAGLTAVAQPGDGVGLLLQRVLDGAAQFGIVFNQQDMHALTPVSASAKARRWATVRRHDPRASFCGSFAGADNDTVAAAARLVNRADA